MDDEKQLNGQLAGFSRLDDPEVSIEGKLDELIELLEKTELDSRSALKMRSRFNAAVRQAEVGSKEDLKPFEVLDTKAPRKDLLDNLEQLLVSHPIDSEISKRLLSSEKMKRASLLLIALILIILGFAMIIMPAPPYFEMFTIFYFSPDDGVTLMDLISLLIVFTGVYLFITSVIKLNTAD